MLNDFDSLFRCLLQHNNEYDHASSGNAVGLLHLHLCGETHRHQFGQGISKCCTQQCDLYMNGCRRDASSTQAFATSCATQVPYTLIVNTAQCPITLAMSSSDTNEDEDGEDETSDVVLAPLLEFWQHHNNHGPTMIQLSNIVLSAASVVHLTNLLISQQEPQQQHKSQAKDAISSRFSGTLHNLKLEHVLFGNIPPLLMQPFVQALQLVPSVDLSGCTDLPLVDIISQPIRTPSKHLKLIEQPKSSFVLLNPVSCQELILSNTPNLFQNHNGAQSAASRRVLKSFFDNLLLTNHGFSLLELTISNCAMNDAVALALFSALEHPRAQLQKLCMGGHSYEQLTLCTGSVGRQWVDCLSKIACLRELYLPQCLWTRSTSASSATISATINDWGRLLKALSGNTRLTKVKVQCAPYAWPEQVETVALVKSQISVITNRNVGIALVQDTLSLAADENTFAFHDMNDSAKLSLSSSSLSSYRDYYWSALGILTSSIVLEPIQKNPSALYQVLQQGIFPLLSVGGAAVATNKAGSATHN